MITLYGIWLALVAGAAVLALKTSPATAFLLWPAIVAVACGLGAALLASQPIGRATLFGRIGSSVVHWGFRAGRGRLFPAVVISWLVWTLLGLAVINIVHHRDDTRFILLELAWIVDVGALFYITGIALRNSGSGSRFPRSLAPVVLGLVAMVAISAVLWFGVGSAWARHTALLVAGGPTLLVGGGYALFLIVMLTFGRKARWN